VLLSRIGGVRTWRTYVTRGCRICSEAGEGYLGDHAQALCRFCRLSVLGRRRVLAFRSSRIGSSRRWKMRGLGPCS
jgi:hypothetical protein